MVVDHVGQQIISPCHAFYNGSLYKVLRAVETKNGRFIHVQYASGRQLARPKKIWADQTVLVSDAVAEAFVLNSKV
jgi:predicted amidohydrolase YtcJ